MENLQFAMLDEPRPPQPFEQFGVDPAEFFSVLSQFEPFGVWRMDLETGLVYWTRDIFEIHEIPFTDGPVNIKMAIEAYHPDDQSLLMDCLEDVVARKSAYHFVLRLATRAGGYKYVKSLGKYYVMDDGTETLIGTFCEAPGGPRGVVVKQ